VSDVGKVFTAAFNRCNHIGLGHKIVDEGEKVTTF
jgi:hypothetical protein